MDLFPLQEEKIVLYCLELMQDSNTGYYRFRIFSRSDPDPVKNGTGIRNLVRKSRTQKK